MKQSKSFDGIKNFEQQQHQQQEQTQKNSSSSSIPKKRGATTNETGRMNMRDDDELDSSFHSYPSQSEKMYQNKSNDKVKNVNNNNNNQNKTSDLGMNNNNNESNKWKQNFDKFRNQSPNMNLEKVQWKYELANSARFKKTLNYCYY